LLHVGAPAPGGLVRYYRSVIGSTRLRWFYAFLLVLFAWGGFVQVALKDDLPQRQIWDDHR